MSGPRPGALLRVIDIEGCKDGKGRKPPFAIGDVVECERVNASGRSVAIKGKPGWWAARRFAVDTAR